VKSVLSLMLSMAFVSTAFAQQGRGGRGAGPEPRIVSFEVRPGSIRPGESALLVWSTENPAGVSIDPEVGPVIPRGSKQVTPAATTTYTLTLRNGPSKTVTVTVAGAPVAKPASASAANAGSRNFRMPDGKPDLTGVYNFAGLPAGAKAPALKPGADKYVIVRGPNDVRGRTTLGTDCKPLGIPQTYITPYPFQMVQTPGDILLTYAYDSATRVVYMSKHRAAELDTWMGTNNGHWEGDTLVIDVTGFNGRAWLDRAGNFASDSLHVVERYTMVDANTINYEATIDDPDTYTKPWRISFPLYRHREKNARLLYFRCVEFAEEMMYGDLTKKPK